MQVDIIGTRGFPLVEGGVEKHCEALYPRINRNADITVYRRRPYVDACGSCGGVRFIDLPSTRVKGLEAVLHSFLATCITLKHKPDIAHYHNIGPALFSPLLKLRSIPMVLTYHSPNYEHDKWGGGAKKLLMFCERIALRNARRVIFVNKFQMQRYPEDVKAKSVYIPNGIVEPSVPDGCGLLARFGLEPGKYLLSVGRITPEKGFDTLIRAFKEARPGGFKLAIVGGVESESGYKEELDRLSRGAPVVFVGQLHGEDLAQTYQNAALYVLASRNEGFPLVLLEAMSYGLDVLASDIPATRLVPLEDKDYCHVDDVAALAKGIERKLKDPRRREYDLASFDWDEIAGKTLGVYDAVLAENVGRHDERALC